MRQRSLGSSGLLVSELCLGGMTFGNEVDSETAAAIVAAFRDAGGTFLDTADIYHQGRSETFIGKAIAGCRDEFVVAAKAGLRAGDGPNQVGASSVHLQRSLDQTLRNLGCDHVDLFQLHCWDPLTPVEDLITTFKRLLDSGKCRYVGVSNTTGWQLATLAQAARAEGVRILSTQVQYSLVERAVERDVIPAAVHHGAGVLAWGPLGGGFLSGKFSRQAEPPAGSRLARTVAWMEEHWPRRAVERNWLILDELRAIAGSLDAAVAQVALAWLLARPAGVIPIIGATDLDQARQNLAAAEVRLSPEQLARLDAASALEPEYPQRFIDTAMRGRTGVGDADEQVGLR